MFDQLPARILGSSTGRYFRPLLERRFSPGSSYKLLIAYEKRAITEAQIFPFAYFSHQLRTAYGAETRFVENSKLIGGVPKRFRGADSVVFQSWLTDPPQRLEAITSSIVKAFPKARRIYFDGFANNDLRFARYLDPFVASYAKKSLLKNRRAFFAKTLGHTNLTDYYSRLFGIDDEITDWKVPERVLEKLHLLPNFFVAARFLDCFRSGQFEPQSNDRPIDVHARLELDGSPWYQAMRRRFDTDLRAITGISVQTGRGLPWDAYMAELGQSKICASPFGYGELCWRDVEAILKGAVLLKPDMGHLDCLPNIYRPFETYVPVRWDLSDLEERVLWTLEDETRRNEIASTAFQTIQDYLLGDSFVQDMSFVFDSGGTA